MSDAGADFDTTVRLDVTGLEEQVTWGTNPGQACALSGEVPDPRGFDDPVLRDAAVRAQHYMGLAPGTRLSDLELDAVFIGSCTNGRLEDLLAAADVLRGRRVRDGLQILVSPGSTSVRKEAERLGLHEVFRAAGAQWRGSGARCAPALTRTGSATASAWPRRRTATTRAGRARVRGPTW